MARAKKNPAPVEPATGTTEQAKSWTTKSHSDGDVRIPAPLRELLKIAGHETFIIQVAEFEAGESSDTGFTLRFVRQTS